MPRAQEGQPAWGSQGFLAGANRTSPPIRPRPPAHGHIVPDVHLGIAQQEQSQLRGAQQASLADHRSCSRQPPAPHPPGSWHPPLHSYQIDPLPGACTVWALRGRQLHTGCSRRRESGRPAGLGAQAGRPGGPRARGACWEAGPGTRRGSPLQQEQHPGGLAACQCEHGDGACRCLPAACPDRWQQFPHCLQASRAPGKWSVWMLHTTVVRRAASAATRPRPPGSCEA